MLRWALPIVLLAVSLPAAAVYKWVDENGKVHYGDRIPPQYAKQQREVINEQGVTTQTIPRQKTPEELAAEKKAREQAQVEAEKKKKQDAEDRLLMQTYSNVQALDADRKDRLGLIDSSLQIAQKSRAGTDTALKQLQSRKAAAEKNGGQAPPTLLKQIKDHERSLKETDAAIAKLQKDRVILNSKFDKDRKRFLELQQAAAAAQAGAAGETTP